MRLWHTRELAILERDAHKGARALSVALERSVGSVQLKAHRLGISLRRRGSTRGRLRHQVTHVVIPPEIRDLALAGVLDLDPDVPLEVCPHCGRHYVSEPSGTCRSCRVIAKLDAYIADHAEALEAAGDAQRDYDMAKQRHSRYERGIRS